MKPPTTRVHLVVYGTVQGVGFRYFVREAARRHALAGYVLNRADGSVELEAEGPADAVEALGHTVQHGPPGARVDRVDTLPPTAALLVSPFQIQR